MQEAQAFVLGSRGILDSYSKTPLLIKMENVEL
jgi:hypothetical protein